MLVYKALNDLAPQYLSDDCQLVAATRRRQLRSSGNFKCTLTSTSTRMGDRAFAAAGPRLWNDLPAQVRRPDLSLDTYVPPKTENVFVCSRHRRLVTVVFRRCVQINLLTYLLTYIVDGSIVAVITVTGPAGGTPAGLLGRLARLVVTSLVVSGCGGWAHGELCGEDEFYDAVVDRCSLCRDVCDLCLWPESHSFCSRNCPGSSTVLIKMFSSLNFGSRPSDHYFRTVCLSVCLFVVQSFSQPSLIRFQSNLDICCMSGSSCVP